MVFFAQTAVMISWIWCISKSFNLKPALVRPFSGTFGVLEIVLDHTVEVMIRTSLEWGGWGKGGGDKTGPRQGTVT